MSEKQEIATIRDSETGELVITLVYFIKTSEIEINFMNKKVPTQGFDDLLMQIIRVKNKWLKQ